MRITFAKYHALGNAFLLIESARSRVSKSRLPELARNMCNRNRGVGADGIIYLSGSRRADRKIDIYNADGGWAEKSGNGLRIASVHLAAGSGGRKVFVFETASSLDEVRLVKKVAGGYLVKAQLGEPEFRTRQIPVRTRQKYLINSPLDFGPGKLPVTCVAVGNPHTVLLVDSFDFDWQTLGSEIETARQFPNDTNVEFVKVINRKKIRVKSWERGAGPTGSSGTGAAASVASMVMLGLVDRTCDAVFDGGAMQVSWDADTDMIDLTGPVQFIMEGTYQTA